MDPHELQEFSTAMSNSSLGVLVGRPLEFIEFGEDALIFKIYGVTLITRTDVYYRKDAKTTVRKQDAWIDLLCTCMGRDIIKAEKQHDTDIVLTFDDQSQIFMSLRERDRTGSPAVLLEHNVSW